MSDHHRTENEKWAIAQFQSQYFLDQVDESPLVEKTIGEYWPFLNPYYSPLNSCYSPFYQNYLQSRRATQDQILLRDGAIPLVWFFSQTKPEQVGGVLIHSRFAPLVPEKWRAKVRLYRHRSLVKTPPKKLLLVVPFNERILSLEGFDSMLDRIEGRLGKTKMKTMEIHLFFRLLTDQQIVMAKMLQKFFSRFKNVKVVDFPYFENTSALDDVAYFEFNEGWIFQDSLIQQQVLARGASLLFDSSAGKAAQYVPFSPFHGVELTGMPKNPRTENSLVRKFEIFFWQASKDRGVPTPALWPDWHERWCRALWEKELGLQRS